MNVLKNIHIWGFLGLMLQLFIYVVPYALAHIEDCPELFCMIGVLLAFFVLIIGHRKTQAEKRTEIPSKTSTPSAQQAVKILSSLYAVIAGLSLTTAIKEISSLENIFLGLGNGFAFFVAALPFYNGATMFLVTNYYLRGFEGKRTTPLIDFFMLFSQAVALYSMAINVTNLRGFIASLFFLLLTDVVWVLYILARKWRYEVPREWLWLDFYMFSFLALFWLSSKPSGSVLAIIATFRTLTDYCVAGKYYLPS